MHINFKSTFQNHSLASLGFLIGSLSFTNAQTYIAAEDEASYDTYTDGWQSQDSGGRGFGAWQLYAPEYATEGEQQYAGFFIADAAQENDLKQTARKGKAFGIFANGTGFEETVAFRSFERPLSAGDVFSLRFEFNGFSDRFETESLAVSSVGIALRQSLNASSLADLTEGRAMVFAALKGLSTYQILDAEPRFNTRVFIDPEGVELAITIRAANRYDLQLKTLSDNVVHRFPDRAFNVKPINESAEAQAAALQSFALFNLNGGDSNAYFGALQVATPE